MRGKGVRKTEKIFKRLTDESKTHSIWYQQEIQVSPACSQVLRKGWEGVESRSDLLDYDYCSGGESEQGMLSGGQGPAEVKVSLPLPLQIPVILPPQYKQASNQGGLAANNS